MDLHAVLPLQDIAPNYCGTLYGMGRTLADGATGFLVPPVIEAITSNSLTTPRTWRIVFLLAAALYCTGAAAFVVLYRERETRCETAFTQSYGAGTTHLIHTKILLRIFYYMTG